MKSCFEVFLESFITGFVTSLTVVLGTLMVLACKSCRADDAATMDAPTEERTLR